MSGNHVIPDNLVQYFGSFSMQDFYEPFSSRALRTVTFLRSGPVRALERMVTLGQGLGLAMSLLSWVGNHNHGQASIDLIFVAHQGDLPLLPGASGLGSQTTFCLHQLTVAVGGLHVRCATIKIVVQTIQ